MGVCVLGARAATCGWSARVSSLLSSPPAVEGMAATGVTAIGVVARRVAGVVAARGCIENLSDDSIEVPAEKVSNVTVETCCMQKKNWQAMISQSGQPAP